jgi:hypothetical protein
MNENRFRFLFALISKRRVRRADDAESAVGKLLKRQLAIVQANANTDILQNPQL